MVDSREIHASKVKTFDRRIDKEFTQARKSLKKLGIVVFACEADARKVADRWISENPHFVLRSLSICVVSKRTGSRKGCPKKDEQLEKGYLIEVEVERNEEIIANVRARLGRFVLASNDKTLDGELMLQYYKGQKAVEKGFRFLKDESFRIAEVYLKKVEQIEALSMIMILSLLIYSIAEWMLRKN